MNTVKRAPAEYWVTMTDRAMSGWGAAEGTDNKLVIECETYEQATRIHDHAQSRPEMKYINIRSTKPRYPNAYVSWKTYNDMTGWH